LADEGVEETDHGRKLHGLEGEDGEAVDAEIIGR
jgi:hypothetical protein